MSLYKTVDATCKCGYIGKSSYPKFYQCEACCQASLARMKLVRAGALEARAAKLRFEAARLQAKSDALRTACEAVADNSTPCPAHGNVDSDCV
jgi:hypothetical protein